MLKYLIVLLCSSFNFIIAQSNEIEIPLLGFGCSETLNPTKAVGQFGILLKTKKYKKITNALYSENSAEKFLSVIISEKLKSLGKIRLTEKDSLKIAEIKNSNELITVCSGCTYYDKLTMRQLFDEKNIIKESSIIWLMYYF